jgi:hypothetical protein
LPVNTTGIPAITTPLPAPKIQPTSATVSMPADNAIKPAPVTMPTKPIIAQLKSPVPVAANKLKLTKLPLTATAASIPKKN